LTDLLYSPVQACVSTSISSTTRQHFLDNVRRYNAAMSFVSFVDACPAKIHDSHGAPHGPPVFILHGQARHLIGTLQPSEDVSPSHAQLYTYDPEEAANKRIARAPGLDPMLLATLHRALAEASNPFIAALRHMHHVVEEQRHRNADVQVVLRFRSGMCEDPRRYNEPSGRDIAAVYVGDAPPTVRDISIYDKCRQHGAGVRQVSHLNEHLDALAYPLLFPGGDRGWCPELLTKDLTRKMSQSDFFTHRLMVRSSAPALPHAAGRLFQQYCVDAFCRVEAGRLHWIRQNQGKMRAECLGGLTDFVAQRREVNAGNGSDELSAAHLPHSLPRDDELGAASPEGRSDGQDDELRAASGGPSSARPATVGKRIYLPASFSGSPRYMYQCYLDAMALVGRFGRPDYFLTMTASPRWPEIQSNLRHGETAANRPDLVARVFKKKFALLLDDLLQFKVFGVVIAYTYVIEFQERGLPHAHVLLIMSPADRPRTAKDIDRLVSAELPNAKEHPKLRQLVEKCMLHGPCGDLNPACVCMRDGKCSKHYPKEFREETLWCENGYPQYRRRMCSDGSGQCTRTGSGKQDNRWIVPYSQYLLLRFECHINVEICSSIKSIKYVYKCTYKGPDRACMELVRDEVQEYLDARYLTAPEAVWRLFSYPLHARSHAVERLPVHLPGNQIVTFLQGKEAEALDRSADKPTKLMAWFDLNRKQCDSIRLPGDELCAAPHDSRNWPAKLLLYVDIPSHYVWHSGTASWQQRARSPKGGQVVGRMFSVSPKDTELFALRLLLLHCAGARGFDDLKFANGTAMPTFREAAAAKGLLRSSDEFDLTMEEVIRSECSVEKQCETFALLLVWHEVVDGRQSWQRHWETIAQPWLLPPPRGRGYSPAAAHNALFALVSDCLEQFALTPDGYMLERMPGEPCNASAPVGSSNGSFAVFDSQEQSELLASMPCCTAAQQVILDAVLRRALGSSSTGPNVFYVDGPAGCGKTFLYTKALRTVRSKGKMAVAVAMSGIAAQLLEGGRTVHSRFRLPIPLPHTGATCNMSLASVDARILMQASLLVWDEAPNAPKAAFDAVDQLLRDMAPGLAGRNGSLPFGGMTVLLGGDFRQLPPVLRRMPREDVPAFTLAACSFFQDKLATHHFSLQGNMRARTDVAYSDYCLAVGDASPALQQPGGKHASAIAIPDMVAAHSGANIANIVEWVYPGFDATLRSSHEEQLKYAGGRAIVTPTNAAAADINSFMLASLDFALSEYASIDSILSDEEVSKDFTPEFLHTVETGSMPPHILRLAPGTLLMVLRNYAPHLGICNGTRVICKHCGTRTLTVTVLAGARAGEDVILPRICCDSGGDADLPFTLRRYQFPVKLAWAMTISKSQGQEFTKRLAIFLPQPVFSHGMLYVALSRAPSASAVRLFLMPHDDVQGWLEPQNALGGFTLNIVDPALLPHRFRSGVA